VEKVDLCKGYQNPQKKKRVAMHFFEIISLESQQKINADISIFLKIHVEGEDISSQLSVEFAFTYRKANIYKDRSENYIVNGNIKTIFGMFLRVPACKNQENS